MAGSIKWMNYLSDDGDLYSVLVDESIGEQTGFTDVTGTGDGSQIPRYMRMRYVNGVSADGQRRKAWVGNPENALWTDGGSFTGSDGTVYNISSRVGEKSRLTFAIDTGLIDGDAT